MGPGARRACGLSLGNGLKAMGRHRKPNGPTAGNDNREALAKIARLIAVPDENEEAEQPEGDVAEETRESAQALALLQEPGAAVLLEALPAGLAVCDGTDLIRLNSAFALAFGYGSTDDLQKAGGLSAIFPAVSKQLKKQLQTKTSNVSHPIDLDARSRSGREFCVPVAVHPIASEGSEQTALLVLHPRKPLRGEADTEPDNKEQRVANASNAVATRSVEPAQKRKKARKPRKAKAATPEPLPTTDALPTKKADFLAKVSHELRTPLNSIIGFAEIMKEEQLGPVGNERYRGYIRDIHESGMYALSLVNDLLDISKIEAGEFELNFAAVDVNDVAGESVHSMQPQAQRQRVLLRTDLEEDLPQVLADRRSIKQIILNLVSNAIKFTNSGGQVIVSTQKTGSGGVRIRVHDTGIGMSEDEIEVAMKPFQQPDTAPRKQVGTGLGLPLTKALVEANRATFKLRSTSDAGTRIDVTFGASRIAKPRDA